MRGDRDHALVLLDLYGDALPQVYGYLARRCPDRHTAEEITADTFLAALGQAQRGRVEEVTVAWLIGIARHKLVDHWRREARTPDAVSGHQDDVMDTVADDPWDEVIDAHRVAGVMEQLGPHHRTALTLRYVDGLPVPEVADLLGRTVHATEALLVRARRAFRAVYEGSDA